MLFESIRLGTLELPNRLMRSATWEGMATDFGYVTDELVALYRDLARGGVGLIVTGFAYVVPSGRALPRQVGVYDDRQVAGLARIADAVHREGGRVAAQIVHAGAQTRPEWIGDQTPVAPSAVTRADGHRAASGLKVEQIDDILTAFGAAARRVREAGFDAVQLHIAHGYLLSQFLSPHRNTREDDYGGSLEKRLRAPLAATDVVRAAVGADFPVLAKLNAVDCVEGGLELDDAVVAAQALAEAGLDGLEVSGGIPDAGERGAVRPGIKAFENEAYFRAEAAAIKAAVDIPVYVVGGLRSPELMEEILARGDADGVSLCRPFIREPDLPTRWRAGDPAVSECVSCRGCLKMGMGQGIRCAVLEKRKQSAT